MKKLFLTGISLLFALTLTFAQDANPEDKAREKVAKLTEKLTLTDEQQTSVYDIVLEHAKAKQALKADASQSPEALAEAKGRLQETTDAQIKEKLSDEQKTQYDRIIAERPQEETPAPATPIVTPPVEPAEPAQPMEPQQPISE
ncbi:hypothetical protein [Sphingobacterium corticibacterium]|uniref:DUF4890 domain-containing protein n=1 Tax=Sphingobacterium corticibacterium TaxID=2484746 RepID=A0A4Q6XU12_9SPHI|nr:hypothetical protein [Sphingobacterium corticibacterium]RZF60309.1 hypothetical protein EWE74_14480 [Sphingobacterium corticibacterium]